MNAWPAPYGAAAPRPVAQPTSPASNRLLPLGLVSVLLALFEIGWFGYKLIGALIAGLLDHAQRALLPGAVPAPVASAVARVTETVRKLAAWELVSLTPIGFMSVALAIIAVGLMMDRPWWLTAARVWCCGAYAALVVSLSIQVFVLAPQIAEVQRFVDRHLAAGGARSSVVVPTMLPMILHAMVLGLWPLILFLWAGRARLEGRLEGR